MGSVRVALAVFLRKMRLGLANSVLSSIFQLKSKRVVSQIIYSVQKALMDGFLPNYIGFQQIDRQTVINQQSLLLYSLVPKITRQLPLIEHTLYIQKSSDNEFQRRSYS